jgi:F-type H+-transporting ATPase subunit gamma
VRDPVVGAIVFGSDQGLVGAFNNVLADYTSTALQAARGKTAKIWAVGDRLHVLLANTGLTQSEEMAMPTSVEAITPLVALLLSNLEEARDQDGLTDVYIFHNRPKEGAGYEPVSTRLLPLDQAWEKSLTTKPWPTNIPPEVIGGVSKTLDAFVQGYLFVLLFQACAESLASENASRLAAMQRAEKNIDDILEDLNRTYHRVRQEGIDEELFDVISGYTALSKQARRSAVPAKAALP